MPAIIELKEADRENVIKLLDNLNLGFKFAGFGKAFVAMLDGAPLTLKEQEKAELITLINNLNLGFFHLNAGELVTGLLDAPTQKATATSAKQADVNKLVELFDDLNLGLKKLDIGGMFSAAITAITATQSPVTTTYKLTALPAPTNFKVGDVDIDPKTLFTVTPANTAFTVTVDKAGNGTLGSDGKLHPVKAGPVVLTAKVDADPSVTATLTVTVKDAAPPALNKLTLSGTNVAADTAANSFKVTVKADGSDAVTITVGKEPAGAEYGALVTPTIDGPGKAFVDEGALAWDASHHTFVVKGKAGGNAVVTVTNGTKTATLNVTVSA